MREKVNKVSDMKRVALIEKTTEGLYSVYAPDLEDVVIGTGNTVEEAKADFENSMQEMIRYKEEKGLDTSELKRLRFESLLSDKN